MNRNEIRRIELSVTKDHGFILFISLFVACILRDRFGNYCLAVYFPFTSPSYSVPFSGVDEFLDGGMKSPVRGRP